MKTTNAANRIYLALGWLTIALAFSQCRPQRDLPVATYETGHRVRDLIGDRFVLRREYPDTLNIGDFTLIVERYTHSGTWNAPTKTYTGLSGYGRIKFRCQNLWLPWVPAWKNTVLKPFPVTVVDTVRNFENEISLQDAKVLGVPARVGERVELQLPSYGERTIDLVGYLNDLYPIRQPEGIRVAFENITVQVPVQRAVRGTVVAGVATYPTVPPIPEPPFSLNVAAGFRLEVEELTIGIFGALAKAKLALPASLTASADCRAATLDLGRIALSYRCEFYKELPDSTFAFGVGATTLSVQGRGFVADFSTTQTYGPSGKSKPWKGVFLFQGESAGTPSGVVSNIGYLQARYNFTNGLVESDGLWTTFNCSSRYRYGTTQPADYEVVFNQAQVRVERSRVANGSLRECILALPERGVRDRTGNRIEVRFSQLSVDAQMNLRGSDSWSGGSGLYWGDLLPADKLLAFGLENTQGRMLAGFWAVPRPAFYPLDVTGQTFNDIVQWDSLQGVTFLIGSELNLLINARNVPAAWRPFPPGLAPHLRLRLFSRETMWLNVVTEGVHCTIESPVFDLVTPTIGDPSDPLYVGKTPFKLVLDRDKGLGSIRLTCVESAVFECDFRGQVDLAEPSKTKMGFKEMCFTSTAQNAGGKVDLSAGGSSLSYWGLAVVPKPGFSSSGLVSVRTGQIVLTAAGLDEPRHFAEPFYLTWGELLANGEVGRMFFDYNSAGQKFDGFNFVTSGVALSPYDPAQKAFLRVGGMAHFPFFGGDYLHIKDFYDPAQSGVPFNSRVVELSNDVLTGFTGTDYSISGNWSGGKAIFNFDIAYDAATQSGFTGTGPSRLLYLVGGDVGSTLTMNERGSCIRIGSDLLDQRSLALGPVANITNISRIWGCACIVGDQVANIVVGGEVTNAANMSILARAGSTLQAVMQVTPSITKVTIDGEAFVSLAAAIDVMVNGHIQLLMDFDKGVLEGEAAGQFRTASGALLVGSSLEGEGEANWHLGSDYQSIQGMLALKVMGVSGGVGLAAGFYTGINAPKDKAWVLIGKDPRYKLNMSTLPNRLTGVYGFVHVRQGVNYYVVSGEYEVFVGLGAFITPFPTVVGNLGGRIHGEILGGLVSAGAHFNLQVVVGPPCGLGFQGTVGLEGCVAWVVCGSVDITVGMNGCRGFYID